MKWLLFLLFCVIFLHSFKHASAACHVDDQAGLLAFKSGITHDPSGILSSWKPGTDCCSWNGISCLDKIRVNAIWLYGNLDKPNGYLTGTISPSLVKVQNLDGIYVHNHNITGLFPGFLSGLPKLRFIYIDDNKLSGPLPPDIGKMTQLYSLSLSGNQFTGLIPSSVASLTLLSQLELGNNLLSGPIPPAIGKLTQLNYLSLRIHGTLRLSHNKFSGKIPKSIASLAPTLAYLELDHNAFTGTIPSFLGMLKALDKLDLSWNNFTQTVPKSFGNLTKIFNLDLSHNSLVDPLPVMNVTGIESLDLSYNKFNLKQIPNWVTSSPIIYSLKLAKCGIKMNLNDWKPKETYFYDYIDLSYNEISGSPVWLLNKTDYLVGFSASANKLRFDLGSLKIAGTLRNLEMSRNLVYGKVPKSVSGLKSLNLSYNHLCGQLPPTKFPAGAFVGNDCLCGSPLPPCKVKGSKTANLRMRVGLIRKCSHSQELKTLRFNLKQIPNWVTSSPIIYSLKLAKCGIKMSLNDWKPKQTYFYDYIDLSYNEISGSPVWLLNKTDYLVGFSASGNKLRFDLGSLKIAGTLRNLELSRNLVYGKVPKSVSGLTSLNLSYNHLCGQLPPTKFPAGAFVGNDCLCGSPLPPCKVKGK
uniref:Leucine-rich repeat-containing N-terminal plant-type domain-containing protein n=1 Tax=Salix viminalis TaxID=40686 RepID=A0A6N2MDW6_SALVM